MERTGGEMNFIGVLLPDDLSHRIEGYRRFMNQKYGCRSGHSTPLHVTLVPPFQAQDGLHTKDIASALAKMAIEKKWHKFNAKIDGFDAFGDRTLFAKVLPSTVWSAFRSAVYSTVSAASPGSLRRDSRPFQPHITVANRDIPSGASTEALEYLNELELKTTFPVDNITIFERQNYLWVISRKIEI